MFVWEPKALVGVLALVLGWAAGIAVYAASPRRTRNRALAVLLVLEGTGVGIARGVNAFIDPVEHFDVRQALLFVVAVSLVILPLVYWIFLATLPSRLARLMRFWPLLAVAVALSLYETWYLLTNPAQLDRTYFLAANLWTAFGLLGLLVAFTVVWESPRGSQARRQGLACAFAFGVRDLGWFLYFWWISPTYGALEETSRGLELFFAFFAPGITVAFIALLAHAILKTQLFDIDLKLKVGIKRSTLAGFFVATLLVVSQLVQNLTTSRFGLLFGAVAAGLLMFALRPLERAAERVADAALPGVEGTPAYLQFRKLEVYKAAVEELAVGGVTAKERRALDALCDKLGIAAADAGAIERDLTAPPGGPAVGARS